MPKIAYFDVNLVKFVSMSENYFLKKEEKKKRKKGEKPKGTISEILTFSMAGVLSFVS